MIGAFPDLYPDEMLISGWGRYEAWVGHTRRPALLEELFGGAKYTLVFDLPAPLGYFAASLPPGHSVGSVDQLIQQHTLLPYYTAFMPGEQIAVAYEMMQGERPVNIHSLVGLAGTRSPAPRLLRYCPCCVMQDRGRDAETYWHRIHQAAGVQVCPQHAVWLETSTAPMWLVNGPTTFPTAEAMVQSVKPRELNPQSLFEQKLLWVAENVQWLLDHPEMSAEIFRLDERFNLALVSLGLSTYNRHRKVPLILAHIRETLTSELLACLGCDWGVEKYGHWVNRLLRNADDTRFALYRLLLVLSFAESIPAFLEMPAELHPFGEGPWPCLSPGCPLYRQPCIATFEMDFNSKGFPRGTFACECGFIYSRVGPESDPQDRYRAGTILARGALWEQMLQTLWFDPEVKVAEMERQLHSSWPRIRDTATHLGLPFPPAGIRPSIRTATPLARRGRIVDPTPYRKAWLELMRQHPEAGVKVLSQIDLNLYCWLRNNDLEWFNTHVPPRKPKPKSTGKLVDRNQRDQEMVSLLYQAFERLQERQDPPMRISANALLIETGQRSQFGAYRSQMPLATAVLEQLTESHEAFTVRRIWNVARRMHSSGIAPRRYVLVEASGAKRFQADPSVQAALDAALAWLQAPGNGTLEDNFILPQSLTQEVF